MNRDEMFSELLYDDQFIPVIREHFSDLIVDESAKDFIHEHRVEIFLPEDAQEKLYRIALVAGFATCLFGFSLSLRMSEQNPLPLNLAKQWLSIRHMVGYLLGKDNWWHESTM